MEMPKYRRPRSSDSAATAFHDYRETRESQKYETCDDRGRNREKSAQRKDEKKEEKVAKKEKNEERDSTEFEVPVEAMVVPAYMLITECRYWTKNATKKKTLSLVCDCHKIGRNCSDDDCVNRAMLTECPSSCPATNCQNQRFTKKENAAVEAFHTGTKKGFGLRATKEIRHGQFIMEYVGECLERDDYAKRKEKYGKSKTHKHHYFCDTGSLTIDATTMGNQSRFINHSCDPNAICEKWMVPRTPGDVHRIGFFAKRLIRVGEEITFDYQFVNYGREAQICFCASKKCTGYIGRQPNEHDSDEDDENDLMRTEELDDDTTTIGNSKSMAEDQRKNSKANWLDTYRIPKRIRESLSPPESPEKMTSTMATSSLSSTSRNAASRITQGTTRTPETTFGGNGVFYRGSFGGNRDKYPEYGPDFFFNQSYPKRSRYSSNRSAPDMIATDVGFIPTPAGPPPIMPPSTLPNYEYYSYMTYSNSYAFYHPRSHHPIELFPPPPPINGYVPHPPVWPPGPHVRQYAIAESDENYYSNTITHATKWSPPIPKQGEIDPNERTLPDMTEKDAVVIKYQPGQSLLKTRLGQPIDNESVDSESRHEKEEKENEEVSRLRQLKEDKRVHLQDRGDSKLKKFKCQLEIVIAPIVMSATKTLRSSTNEKIKWLVKQITKEMVKRQSREKGFAYLLTDKARAKVKNYTKSYLERKMENGGLELWKAYQRS